MDPRLRGSGLVYLLVAAIAAVVCVGARVAGATDVSLVAKFIPMIALAGFVVRFGVAEDRVPVATALVLSGVGDVLIERPNLFVAAMVAFALAHVAYVVGFVRTDAARALRPFVLACVVGYAAALVAVAYPALGPLRAPVVLYAGVIATMMWRAVARMPPSGARGPERWVAASALVFGASDSLILLKLAGLATDAVNPLILATYWAAQAGFAWAATTRRTAA